METESHPLAFLVGTWRGSGRGEYPTIEPFAYDEEVEIAALPSGALSYAQRTRDAATGAPRHAESGWFRVVGDGVELVVAQPTGIAEVHAGPRDGQVLELRAGAVVATPSAVEVRDVTRRIEVRDDVMTYRLAMAAVGQPLTHHLAATLRRA